MPARAWFALAVASLFVAPSARADREADLARKHYEEGTKAYELGEFQRAIVEYKAAYEVHPDAAFLYNIAQAYRLEKDFENALFFYRSFLRKEPAARERRSIQDRIREMEAQIEQQRKVAAAGPVDIARPEASSHAVEETPPPPPLSEAGPLEQPRDSVETQPAAHKASSERKPLLRRAWFWVGVAGALAVVAAAVGIGVALSEGGSPPTTHFGLVHAF